MRGRTQFIADLVKKHGWSAGVEVGVADGKNYLGLLEACPELNLIGVDAYEHLEDEMEFYRNWNHQKNEKHVRTSKAKYGDRALLITARSEDAARLVPDNSVDFVFIDADHRFDAVLLDIRTWGSKLKPTGLLMGHDIDWEGVRAAVIQELVDYRRGPDNVWYAVVSGPPPK